jgi:hypothetical protein
MDPQSTNELVHVQVIHGIALVAPKPILLVAYRLRTRYSEIVRLTWDRVDRERGLITLVDRHRNKTAPPDPDDR